MATNTSSQKQDITQQMQDFIKDLNMMADNVANETGNILRESGEIIAQEQRRLISGKSSKLPGLIKVGNVIINKKGKANVMIGYDTEAINQAPESVVIEFGRPGKKSKGIDSKGRKIGKIEAISHIRRGFDNVKETATEQAIERIKNIIDKGWKGDNQ